jgi:hypothetical protein
MSALGSVPGVVLEVLSIGGAIGDLFSGNKQGAKLRDKKRKELSKLGFIWQPTKGVPPGQEWNIDNWPDKALDNLFRAYQVYGQSAVSAHNKKMLSPSIASNYRELERVVKNEQGFRPDNVLNTFLSGNAQQVQGSSLLSTKNLLGFGVLAGASLFAITKLK